MKNDSCQREKQKTRALPKRRDKEKRYPQFSGNKFRSQKRTLMCNICQDHNLLSRKVCPLPERILMGRISGLAWFPSGYQIQQPIIRISKVGYLHFILLSTICICRISGIRPCFIAATVCSRSLDPFFIVAYYIKWVKTYWTCSIVWKTVDVRVMLEYIFYHFRIEQNISFY